VYRALFRNLRIREVILSRALKFKSPLLALGAALALLAACTGEQAVRRPSAEVQSLERRAQAAEEGGDFGAAAELHRMLAARAAGAEKAGHLLEAARLDIRIGNLDGAAAELGEAQSDANDEQRALLSVLEADIAVHRNRPDDALARLVALPPQLPPRLTAEADRVRGSALFAAGRPVDAVRALVERETWLESAPAIRENQRAIWNGLAASPAARTARATGDPIVDGWLALAPIAAANPSDEELRRSLLEWRRRYADHPAAGGLLADLLRGQQENRGFPTRIALLLPLGSAQRVAAVAIRDGFLAERLDDPAGRDTIIRVYDTGTLGAQQAYARAQLEGADFIVGPLLVQEVEQVLPSAGVVPTLALNFASGEGRFPPSFYQFALSPDDEARLVARQAVRSGARTAAALYPTTARGIRIVNSFREEFEALGGRVIADAGFDPAAQEFSRPIESLLNLDRSEQRRKRLAANLGVSLAFEPRRRQDVDMLFIGADHQTGLLLAPALRFHFAGDIPTYATSAIYEPGSGTGDGDLNGIYFPEAPWLVSPGADSQALRRALESYWPQRAGSSIIRLYGMGIDAYRLVRALYGQGEGLPPTASGGGAGAGFGVGSSVGSDAGSSTGFGAAPSVDGGRSAGSGAAADPLASANRLPGWPVRGVSGDLTLDGLGRIHRDMPFAQFRSGQPVAVDTAPGGQRLAEAPRDGSPAAR
jgi:outer membrane PBP1 activator LpoA protein